MEIGFTGAGAVVSNMPVVEGLFRQTAAAATAAAAILRAAGRFRRSCSLSIRRAAVPHASTRYGQRWKFHLLCWYLVVKRPVSSPF